MAKATNPPSRAWCGGGCGHKARTGRGIRSMGDPPLQEMLLPNPWDPAAAHPKRLLWEKTTPTWAGESNRLLPAEARKQLRLTTQELGALQALLHTPETASQIPAKARKEQRERCS